MFFPGCIFLSKSQLSVYNQLRTENLKELCRKNNVNLQELKDIHEVVKNLVSRHSEATSDIEALKGNRHCLGDSLQEELHKEMNIVKRCIEGKFTLDDNSTQTLVDESEKKLCAYAQVCKYKIILIFI